MNSHMYAQLYFEVVSLISIMYIYQKLWVFFKSFVKPATHYLRFNSRLRLTKRKNNILEPIIETPIWASWAFITTSGEFKAYEGWRCSQSHPFPSGAVLESNSNTDRGCTFVPLGRAFSVTDWGMSCLLCVHEKQHFNIISRHYLTFHPAPSSCCEQLSTKSVDYFSSTFLWKEVMCGRWTREGHCESSILPG